jgi:SAM-dependent methyltransferase
MAASDEQTNELAALWNGAMGRGWVEMQSVMDDVLRPMETVLVDAVAAARGTRVLDVGCGAGATTVAIAKRLGDGVSCTGVDISEPLVDAARSRARSAGVDVRFVLADAQRHRFEAEAFDTVVSRFGVMFFDDPGAAFANLRSATSDGGALRALTWRSPAENPFMTTAERAAAPFVELPPRDPDAPGQFALADPDRVNTVLEEGGWCDIDLEPMDIPCSFSAEHLDRWLANLGPIGRLVAGLDAPTAEQVLTAARSALDVFVDDGVVRFTAACWSVRARA